MLVFQFDDTPQYHLTPLAYHVWKDRYDRTREIIVRYILRSTTEDYIIMCAIMNQIILIWFKYGNSVFKFFTFFFQPSIFICKLLIMMSFRLMISSFRPLMLWIMNFSNLSSQPRLISALFFCFWYYNHGTL